jgi:urease accessory protein
LGQFGQPLVFDVIKPKFQFDWVDSVLFIWYQIQAEIVNQKCYHTQHSKLSGKLMFKKYSLILSFTASITLTLLLAQTAQAHVGNHEIGGLIHGLQHPLGGLDHILAMLAVGLWAAQIGGAGLWALPLAFISAMALGGIVGMTGITMVFVEQGILLSDLILGAVVLLGTRLPLKISMGIVGLLAIFHGYAHGAEMPQGVSGLEYATGFVFSTAFLHGLGLGSALLIQKFLADRFIQVAGVGILAGGLWVVSRSILGF